MSALGGRGGGGAQNILGLGTLCSMLLESHEFGSLRVCSPGIWEGSLWSWLWSDWDRVPYGWSSLVFLDFHYLIGETMSVFNKSKEGKGSLSPTLIIPSIDRFTVISSILYHHKLRYFCLWYRLTDSVLVIYKSSVTLQVKVTQKVHQNVARLCLHTVCNVCIYIKWERRTLNVGCVITHAIFPGQEFCSAPLYMSK